MIGVVDYRAGNAPSVGYALPGSASSTGWSTAPSEP